MSIDLSPLDGAARLLFNIALQPLQGQRFQPTGFPGLGAATFRSPAGDCLLVESAQSMANRLEMTLWDEAQNDVIAAAQGISHVTVQRGGQFLTDTILEAHRLNSPYLLEGKDKTFFKRLEQELGLADVGSIDRKRFARALLKLDVGSLIHGVFLSKKELSGGRLRLARAMSCFIEADGVKVAASGGVKNDHVHPGKIKGDSKNHFGNIPFSRDEFSADSITLYANIDLAQIRSYGLGADVNRMLVLLCLYKLRALLSKGLRLRTACDLAARSESVVASSPEAFALPALPNLSNALEAAVLACRSQMEASAVVFDDRLERDDRDEKDDVGDAAEPLEP